MGRIVVAPRAAPDAAGLRRGGHRAQLEQRTQISETLRRGETHADPRVLAAAIRVGTLNLASYCQRGSGWVVSTRTLHRGRSLGFMGNDVRQGVLAIGLALFVASYPAWFWYWMRWLPKHVESLRDLISIYHQGK